MADKEVTVYIVDLGPTMGETRHGRNETDLDWSLRWVWDKISTTVSAGRKTWNVGVLGLRTRETRNPTYDEQREGYEGISVLLDIGPVTMASIRELQALLRVNEGDSVDGDAISAVVVACDMIINFAKHLKYRKQIFLVTDGRGLMDDSEEDFPEIGQKLKDHDIRFTVLGVDFDDPEYGFKEEDKPKLKRKNEALLKRLCDECGGLFGTMAEAIEELGRPRIKPIRPFKSYDGPLTLGNPDKYPEGSFTIWVERYFKTKEAKAPTGTVVVTKAETAPSQSTATMDGDDGAGGDFAAVKNARTYTVNDPDAPGGKRAVEFSSLAKGYEYGRTAVPISESDFNITKFETTKSFTIVGFINCETYQPYLDMGESHVIVAKKFNQKDQLALSSFIHALHELDSYAVARIVTKDMKEPQLVVLIPSIEHDFECLYDVPLPFAEDCRNFQFAPLDKVVTASGAVLTKHRNLPNDALNQAMSDYVDAMDISGADDDGDEYAPIEDTFSPYIHRLNQAIRQRAIHPSEPLPEMPSILTRYAKPDEALLQADEVKRGIANLIKAAEVKKVPPKAKGKRERETVKPISGLDVDALLRSDAPKKAKPEPSSATTRRKAVGSPGEHGRKGHSPAGTPSATAAEEALFRVEPDNAIPTFKRAMQNTSSTAEIESAAAQMGEIVTRLVADSLGDQNYAQACEDLSVLRDELIAFEEPGVYNTFIRDFKRRLLDGELGGDRRLMWREIRTMRLGLIDDRESEVSDVTADDAAAFYAQR